MIKSLNYTKSDYVSTGRSGVCKNTLMLELEPYTKDKGNKNACMSKLDQDVMKTQIIMQLW